MRLYRSGKALLILPFSAQGQYGMTTREPVLWLATRNNDKAGKG